MQSTISRALTAIEQDAVLNQERHYLNKVPSSDKLYEFTTWDRPRLGDYITLYCTTSDRID